jgi:uncharacterized protein YkwD
VRWRIGSFCLWTTLCLFVIPACRTIETTATPGSPTVTSTQPPSPVLLPTSTHTPVPSSTWLPSTLEPTPIIHTIQPGDTLLGLAMHYGVPMAAIQLENGMGESTILYVGQDVVIPSATEWEGASTFWVVYEVKEGETLAQIAQIYGLEADAILEINGLADAGEIGSGDQLVLPLDGLAAAYLPTVAPTSTLVPAPTHTPTPEPSTPVPTMAPVTVSPTIADWPRETVAIINQVRAAHGLGPFAYSETLARAAQAHADDCANRGWCSHVGSDGSDVKTRIVRAGYDPAGWAECWAQSRDPQHAIDMWMDEEPPDDAHRRTLLSTFVTEIGVGVAQTTWGYYFVADFGRP